MTAPRSQGVGFLLSVALRGPSDGVLVPIPQYPLYSASLTLQGSELLGYELDEDNEWSLPVQALEKQITDAKAKGITTRALAVINPGNPTGNSLPYDNMVECIEFCVKHDLVLMADEVYQENIWLQARSSRDLAPCPSMPCHGLL